MRVTRWIGLLLGGAVALVGVMSVVGLATDNFWVRLVGGLVVVVGFPALVLDRILKRFRFGGFAMIADVFAIVLLAIALTLVSVSFVSKPLLVREGDRYARSGSRTIARAVYFVAGVSPTFPGEKSEGPKAPTSASSRGAVDAGVAK
jgi:hypothetical protein